MAKVGVTGKLKEGDVIQIHNPLMKKEYSFYRITKVEGNKAHSGFRIFHRDIYFDRNVYEYGKKLSPWDNGYTVSSEQEAEKNGAEIR